MGGTLALSYVDQNPDANLISGLIALSPALEPRDERAFLSPWLKLFLKWINKNDDRDAVKYESFPTNAAAEFYRLTREVVGNKDGLLELPVFMAVSGDDTTVNNQASLDYFCSNIAAESRKMIWYQSSLEQDWLTDSCTGVEVVTTTQSDRFISYSHVAITIPPSDPHYGIDGNYSVCLNYFEQPELFDRCSEDNEATVYAENSYPDEDGTYQGQLVRRTTFNPGYDELVNELICFINKDCGSDEPAR